MSDRSDGAYCVCLCVLYTCAFIVYSARTLCVHVFFSFFANYFLFFVFIFLCIYFCACFVCVCHVSGCCLYAYCVVRAARLECASWVCLCVRCAALIT